MEDGKPGPGHAPVPCLWGPEQVLEKRGSSHIRVREACEGAPVPPPHPIAQSEREQTLGGWAASSQKSLRQGSDRTSLSAELQPSP